MSEMTPERLEEFRQELTSLINRFGVDVFADTPDFILAEALVAQMHVWTHTLGHLRSWRGWDTLPEQHRKMFDGRQ